MIKAIVTVMIAMAFYIFNDCRGGVLPPVLSSKSNVFGRGDPIDENLRNKIIVLVKHSPRVSS